ncbi:MAG: integration host factor subunit beta [Betaproteobacteria bacterium]
MNRPDLIAKLANRLKEMPVKDIDISTKLILEAIGQALTQGHRTEIRGFGCFTLNHRPPRVGRNPKSGETVHIPAKYSPHFKPGKELRLLVDAAGDSCTNQS